MFGFLSGWIRPAPRRAPRKASLSLETLEDRAVPAQVSVVPLGREVDNATTFHSLAQAIPVAGPGGVVTIEPGAAFDPAGLTITQRGLTIQGNPNIPGSILPQITALSVQASDVTLANLNLGAVTVQGGAGGVRVLRSDVYSVVVNALPDVASSVVVSQNTISGFVTIAGAGRGDLVTDNTFASFSGTLLSLLGDNFSVVRSNHFQGAREGQTAINVVGGQGNYIEDNRIELHGTSASTLGIGVTVSGGPLGLLVRNNAIATGFGVGIGVNAQGGDWWAAVRVEGNDFHNNAVGVSYLGGGGGSVVVDLGGGSLGSLGGNNFRGFVTFGSPTAAAVVSQGPNFGVLSARANIFIGGGTNAASAVFAAPGSAGIDTSASLDLNRSYVQVLFNNLLGRTGTLDELDFWVQKLVSGPAGQTAVLNGILRSDEALTRIVADYYLRYLGRAADPAGTAYWVAALRGGMTLEAAQAGIVSSPEFLSNNDTDFVQALYRNFFARAGTAQELNFWYGKLPSLGLGGLALAFSQSTENRVLFTDQVYDRYLHRQASGIELTYWATSGTDLLTLLQNIFTTTDFYTRG